MQTLPNCSHCPHLVKHGLVLGGISPWLQQLGVKELLLGKRVQGSLRVQLTSPGCVLRAQLVHMHTHAHVCVCVYVFVCAHVHVCHLFYHDLHKCSKADSVPSLYSCCVGCPQVLTHAHAQKHALHANMCRVHACPLPAHPQTHLVKHRLEQVRIHLHLVQLRIDALLALSGAQDILQGSSVRSRTAQAQTLACMHTLSCIYMHGHTHVHAHALASVSTTSCAATTFSQLPLSLHTRTWKVRKHNRLLTVAPEIAHVHVEGAQAQPPSHNRSWAGWPPAAPGAAAGQRHAWMPRRSAGVGQPRVQRRGAHIRPSTLALQFGFLDSCRACMHTGTHMPPACPLLSRACAHHTTLARGRWRTWRTTHTHVPHTATACTWACRPHHAKRSQGNTAPVARTHLLKALVGAVDSLACCRQRAALQAHTHSTYRIVQACMSECMCHQDLSHMHAHVRAHTRTHAHTHTARTALCRHAWVSACATRTSHTCTRVYAHTHAHTHTPQEQMDATGIAGSTRRHEDGVWMHGAPRLSSPWPASLPTDLGEHVLREGQRLVHATRRRQVLIPQEGLHARGLQTVCALVA